MRILHDIGVRRFKIGSGDFSNLLLLKKIQELGGELLISTGMADIDELVNLDKKLDPNLPVSYFHCVSKYPTTPEDWNLGRIGHLQRTLRRQVGLSDHSGSIFPSIAASVLGVKLIEFHATFNRLMFGPDTSSSLDLDQISQLVSGVRQLEQSLSVPGPDINRDPTITNMRSLFGRSLIAAKDLSPDDTLTLDSFEAVKPSGLGLDPYYIEDVLRNGIPKPLKAGDYVNEIN